jgi:hypothetical protein
MLGIVKKIISQRLRRIFCARRGAEIDDSRAIRNFGDEVWCKIDEYTGLLFSWKSPSLYNTNILSQFSGIVKKIIVQMYYKINK